MWTACHCGGTCSVDGGRLDMPVDNDIKAAKGLDDLLHCALHFCIASCQVCHDRQAMLHLFHLYSRSHACHAGAVHITIAAAVVEVESQWTGRLPCMPDVGWSKGVQV